MQEYPLLCAITCNLFVNDARHHKIRNLKNNTTSTNWCPSFPDIRASHLRQFVERIEASVTPIRFAHLIIYDCVTYLLTFAALMHGYSWRPFNYSCLCRTFSDIRFTAIGGAHLLLISVWRIFANICASFSSIYMMRIIYDYWAHSLTSAPPIHGYLWCTIFNSSLCRTFVAITPHINAYLWCVIYYLRVAHSLTSGPHIYAYL